MNIIPKCNNYFHLLMMITILVLLFSTLIFSSSIIPALSTDLELVISDDFSDITNDWTEYLGTWDISNGEYFVTVGIVENGISAVNSQNFTDCIIETKMRFRTTSVGFKAGILFRYMDNEHYYNYVLSNEYDNIVLDEYSPGHSDYAIAISHVGEGVRTIQENINYSLKIIIKGNNFSCFLNGEEVLSGQDDSYSSGKVGLWARNADVYFDDFKVYVEQSIVEDTLVGYWNFDEGSRGVAIDNGSHGYDGILTNGPQWVKGKIGNALHFDGVNDYVDCGSLENFGSVQLENKTTYSFWVKTSQTIPSGFLGVANSPLYQTALIIHFNTPEQDKIRFYMRDDNNNRLSADLAESFDFTTTGWHHFAIVVNTPDNQVEFYIDGISREVTYNYQQSPSAFSNFNHPMYIGALDYLGGINYPSPPIQPPIVTFQGEIDELRIYNYSRNTEEIQNEFLSGVNDPVGYWSFNEGTGLSVSDSSGNNNAGTLVNGPAWTQGKIGTALSFDGIDDYVMIPDSQSLRLQQFTLCAWIYMDTRPYAHSQSNHVAVVNKLDYLFGPAYGYKLDFEYPKSNDDDLVITIGDATAQRFPVKYNSINDLTLNQWHFIAGTFDGTIFKIYIDGNLKATSDPVTYSIVNNNAPLGIGQEVTGASGHFKGKIDEVMVYNRALNELEILELTNLYSSELTIQSIPVSGISFSIDGVLATTPYSVEVGNGLHFVEMPESQFVDGVKYIFQNWVDGNQNRTRVIDLEENLTLTANYDAEPVAQFTYNPQTLLAGKEITFDASGSYDKYGNIVSYLWDFGDGTTFTTNNPITTHTYNSPNSFTVKLTVEDSLEQNSVYSRSFLIKMPTTVSISTTCETTLVGFQVQVNGSLIDIFGNGLMGKPVVLSYTFEGISNWIPITSDQTDALGRYSMIWIPSATGYFTLKVEWQGNSTYVATTNITTISSISFEDQYVFSVESNSTVSDLSFDSDDRTLSFNAKGDSGTRGYVKITFDKILVGSLDNIDVFKDGEQVNFDLISSEDSIYLIVYYDHSTHQIVLDLDTTVIPEFPTKVILALFIMLTLIVIVVQKKLK